LNSSYTSIGINELVATMVSHSAQRFRKSRPVPSVRNSAAYAAPNALNSFNSFECTSWQLQLAQNRTDKLIIRIDPQLIDPMLDLRRHIFVKEAQRAKCQREKHRAFYEFENCDGEQSSVAM